MAEVNTKQHVLTFEKGITNTPSDLICDDDTLEKCEGTTLVNGEWKPIRRAKAMATSTNGNRIIAVHQVDTEKHYISLKSEGEVNDTSQARANGSVRKKSGTYKEIVQVMLMYEDGESKYEITLASADGQQIKHTVVAYFSVDLGNDEGEIFIGASETQIILEEGKVDSSVDLAKEFSAYTYWSATLTKLTCEESGVDVIAVDTFEEECKITYDVDHANNKIKFTSAKEVTSDVRIQVVINDSIVVVTLPSGSSEVTYTHTSHIASATYLAHTPQHDADYVYTIERGTDTYATGTADEDKDPNDNDVDIVLADVLYYTVKDSQSPVDITMRTASYHVNSVSVLGNTIIVCADEGLFYYLWTYGEDGVGFYKYLGNKIPEPDIEFALKRIISGHGDESSSTQLSGEKLFDMMIGVYDKGVKNVHEKKHFCKPFFARAAIEMADGTFTMATNPVLLFPAISDNGGFFEVGSGPVRYLAYVMGYALLYRQRTSYENWKDIVKGVDIFVSDEIEIYDRDWNASTSELNDNKYDRVELNESETYSVYGNESFTFSGATGYKYIKKRTEEEILNDIKGTRTYYKIAEIGTTATNSDGTDGYFSTEDKIQKKTLENLTTQTQLVSGDYYSHCKLYPEKIEMLNRRANLLGVKRGFFEGFSQFEPYTSTEEARIKYYVIRVSIKTPSGLKFVLKSVKSTDTFLKKSWFFYPDSRAYKVEVFRSDTDGIKLLFENNLTEHVGLNGAYCISGLPSSATEREEGTEAVIGSEDVTPEYLSNYVIQSEANNPFLFNASGYIRVGQGKIIGLAGLTTALSQDAYKVATTICFTTQGIWALKTNTEGAYAEVAPSFSREVCTNADSVTMADNAIFFVSSKGLMCITGESESSVVCVSEQMNGRNEQAFKSLLSNCRIAQDYKESLLYLFCKDSETIWVYSIKSKIWSTTKYLFSNGEGVKCVAVVNDYPDTVLQDNKWNLYSLIDRPVIDYDSNSYGVLMQSRALKLDGSLIAKSLRGVKSLTQLSSYDDLEVIVYGCNDERALNDKNKWVELPSLHGKSWKFFKVCVRCTELRATDSISGIILETQRRMENKMR